MPCVSRSPYLIPFPRAWAEHHGVVLLRGDIVRACTAQLMEPRLGALSCPRRFASIFRLAATTCIVRRGIHTPGVNACSRIHALLAAAYPVRQRKLNRFRDYFRARGTRATSLDIRRLLCKNTEDAYLGELRALPLPSWLCLCSVRKNGRRRLKTMP